MLITRLHDESADYVLAREQLRIAEVALMRQREEVAALRRALPSGAQVQDYVFDEGPLDLEAADGPARQVRLSELFSGPGRPVVMYQLMYGKAQTTPCPMCTMWVDGLNGVTHHLAQNMDFVVVAAAPLPELRAHARARDWNNVRLLSCGTSTFKFDLGSEDEHGEQDSTVSVFSRDAAGTLRHVYSAHPRMSDDIQERGIDLYTPVWNMLDLTREGRGDWYPELQYADRHALPGVR